jgi:hypothetical protein
VEEGKWFIMKQARTDAEIDSLLARGGIGATRRDAILEKVLERAQAPSPSRSRWRWAVATAFATGAAAALVLIVPRLSTHEQTPFRAKGSAAKSSATPPSADIECLGATLDACPTGSLVIVRVGGARGFVSAWAEPAGGGERIWYFSADSFSPLVDALSAAPVATTRAVKIGPEHRPGGYVVQILVTERPMAREALLRLPANATLAKGRRLLTITSP